MAILQWTRWGFLFVCLILFYFIFFFNHSRISLFSVASQMWAIERGPSSAKHTRQLRRWLLSYRQGTDLSPWTICRLSCVEMPRPWISYSLLKTMLTSSLSLFIQMLCQLTINQTDKSGKGVKPFGKWKVSKVWMAGGYVCISSRGGSPATHPPWTSTYKKGQTWPE